LVSDFKKTKMFTSVSMIFPNYAVGRKPSIHLSKSITGKQKNSINKDRDKLRNGKVFLALVLDFFDFFIIYLTTFFAITVYLLR